ncbi:hypothetical protein [Halosolutus gelatinilyticus]|uniref:hypothetical protein n=1 Tax=Halosolutus gelatinilyticus TaxID=2931975 RepID=UPI001FF3CA8A|nr:hypothetical protein [Halosolutus gelatinilyticus]
MVDKVREIAASAVLLSIAGYAVWPWGGGPWRQVMLRVYEPLNGDLEVAVLLLAVSAAIGFGIVMGSRIRLSDLATGGVLAYVFWMAVLFLAVSLHEPLLPIITYGLMLVGALFGGVIATVVGNRTGVDPTTKSS